MDKLFGRLSKAKWNYVPSDNLKHFTLHDVP